MIERALMLFKAVAASGGERSLVELAAAQGVPLSSAQRWMRLFERQGLLVQSGRGRRVAGMELVRLAHAQSPENIMRAAARPLLRRYAKDHRTTVHLGTWDGEMVTYLIKEAIGSSVFTREGMKLEGYCSAIGKVLVAHTAAEERSSFLSGGPFVALTPNTIVEPGLLQEELAAVARQGFAIDAFEVQDDLMCCAVPVRDANDHVIAAISTSMMTAADGIDAPAVAKSLFALSKNVTAQLYGYDLPFLP